MVIIWPTKPLVPMPAPAGLFVIGKKTVIIGAIIALASVGGSNNNGFKRIFGTYNILVPIPIEIKPLMPLSLYPITAKPTI